MKNSEKQYKQIIQTIQTIKIRCWASSQKNEVESTDGLTEKTHKQNKLGKPSKNPWKKDKE